MTIGSGIAKQLRYKKESTWGTAPGATGAQLLRRKTSDLNLVKATIESDELRSDYQVADLRHSGRSVQGTIAGELSAKTYQDFLAAALRASLTWTAAVVKTASTIASTATTFTDSGNGFITAGFKVGMIVRCTGWSNSAMNNANVLLTSVAAGTLGVVYLNGTTPTVIAAGTSITITGTKFIAVPTSGHVDTSFGFEHWFSDIAQSELFLGCKVSKLGLKIPGNDKAQIDMEVMGKDVTTATAEYFTTPTSETTTGILTCLNGALYYNGNKIATVTNCEINIEGGHQPSEPVLGSTAVQAIFPGRVRVQGQLSAYWEDATLRDAFLNETTASLVLALASGSTGLAEAMSIVLPKIKLNGSAKDDGEKGLLQTIPFVALLDGSGGAAAATPKTTMYVCDTEAA